MESSENEAPNEGQNLVELIKAAQGTIDDSNFVRKVNGRLYGEVGGLAAFLSKMLTSIEGIKPRVNFTAEELPETSHQLSDVNKMTEEGTHRVMEYVETVLSNHDIILQDLDTIKKSIEDGTTADKQVQETVAQAATLARQNKTILMDMLVALSFQDLAGQQIKKIDGVLREVQSRILKMVVVFGSDSQKDETGDGKQKDLLNKLDGPSSSERLDQAVADDILKEFGF